VLLAPGREAQACNPCHQQCTARSRRHHLFRLMDAAAHQRLVHNIAGAMQGMPHDIQERQVAHFNRADPACGAGSQTGAGITRPLTRQDVMLK